MFIGEQSCFRSFSLDFTAGSPLLLFLALLHRLPASQLLIGRWAPAVLILHWNLLFPSVTSQLPPSPSVPRHQPGGRRLQCFIRLLTYVALKCQKQTRSAASNNEHNSHDPILLHDTIKLLLSLFWSTGTGTAKTSNTHKNTQLDSRQDRISIPMTHVCLHSGTNVTQHSVRQQYTPHGQSWSESK